MMVQTGFISRAKEVLFELRSSTIGVINSLPGKPGTGTELRRTVRIDKTLAWKLISFIEQEDVFLASKYLPGKSSFDTFLKRSRKSNADQAMTERASEAYMGYLDLIEKFAGDRSSLDIILQGASDHGREKIYRDQKKECYLAQRFLYGVSCATSFMFQVVPEIRDGITTIIGVKGFTDLQRFWENPVSLYGLPELGRTNGSGRNAIEAFVPEIRRSRDKFIPYYPEYCSCRMPQPSDRKIVVDDVFPDEYTKQDEQIDLVTAQVVTSSGVVSEEEKEGGNYFLSGVSSVFPTEVLIVDVFIHRNSRTVDPQVMVYNDLSIVGRDQPLSNRSPSERLTFDERILHLGRGIFCSQLRDISWYTDMVSDVFHRIGENDEEYDLFRVRIEYPILPSSVVLEWT